MTRLVSLLFVAAFAARLTAQTAPRFAGVPWNSTRQQTKAQVVAKGYKVDKIDSDSDLVFTGDYLGTPLRVAALFNGQNQLVKVVVRWATEDKDCFPFYTRMQAALIEKYGEPRFKMENYKSPYEKGDGYELTAVRLGKASIATVWDWPDAPVADEAGVILDITDNLTVKLTYESPAWAAESAVRRTKATQDF